MVHLMAVMVHLIASRKIKKKKWEKMIYELHSGSGRG